LECELITLKGAIFGKISFQNDSIFFRSSDMDRPKERKYRYGSLPIYLIRKKKNIIFHSSEVKEVHPRRFNSVHSSVEFFLKRGKVYFFNLYKRINKIKVISFIR
jgi:hypothetical protein